jgi:hypothetical protein
MNNRVRCIVFHLLLLTRNLQYRNEQKSYLMQIALHITSFWRGSTQQQLGLHNPTIMKHQLAKNYVGISHGRSSVVMLDIIAAQAAEPHSIKIQQF